MMTRAQYLKNNEQVKPYSSDYLLPNEWNGPCSHRFKEQEKPDDIQAVCRQCGQRLPRKAIRLGRR